MNQTLGSAPAVVRPLRNETLDHRPPRVAVPTYDRAELTPGVVHIGVGGFHRAHQALYFDELAERGVGDWGVIGVGLRSRVMKEALEPQDLLYTVVERGSRGDAARVVGALDRRDAGRDRWARRFRGREMHVAVEACTGWLLVCDALVAA